MNNAAPIKKIGTFQLQTNFLEHEEEERNSIATRGDMREAEDVDFEIVQLPAYNLTDEMTHRLAYNLTDEITH